MDIEFVNPGVDYMIQRMMDFQTKRLIRIRSERP